MSYTWNKDVSLFHGLISYNIGSVYTYKPSIELEVNMSIIKYFQCLVSCCLLHSMFIKINIKSS